MKKIIYDQIKQEEEDCEELSKTERLEQPRFILGKVIHQTAESIYIEKCDLKITKISKYSLIAIKDTES